MPQEIFGILDFRLMPHINDALVPLDRTTPNQSAWFSPARNCGVSSAAGNPHVGVERGLHKTERASEGD